MQKSNIYKYRISNLIISTNLNQMSGTGPVLNQKEEEELGLLKKEIKEADFNINKPTRSEEIGDKILMYLRNAFWLVAGALTLYYSNFFHHLFRNPNINELFFEISMAGYTIIFGLMIFSSFIMPRISGIKDIEEYNPRLVSVGAVVGLLSVISIIVAIWPVWGWWSLPIFIMLWKGFFAIAIFLPSGDIGNVLFLLVNTGIVLSFYVIEHEGYFHWFVNFYWKIICLSALIKFKIKQIILPII